MIRSTKHSWAGWLGQMELAGFVTSVLLVAAPGAVPAALLFASGAPDYYLCHISMPAFAPTHFYVLAGGYPLLQSDPPAARQGTTGAEFRIAGLPASQFIIVDVQPAAGGTLNGDFFTTGGTVSFPVCHPWQTPGCVTLLLDVTVLPIGVVNNGVILLGPATVPCGAVQGSTFLQLCDSPVATRLCTNTLGFCFNDFSYCSFCPLTAAAGDCTLPVMPSTWSSVRAFYR